MLDLGMTHCCHLLPPASDGLCEKEHSEFPSSPETRKLLTYYFQIIVLNAKREIFTVSSVSTSKELCDTEITSKY